MQTLGTWPGSHLDSEYYVLHKFNCIQAAQKAKAAAAVAKSEVKKCAGKIASKAPKAKKALKRMVSEIDAEDASESCMLLCKSCMQAVLWYWLAGYNKVSTAPGVYAGHVSVFMSIWLSSAKFLPTSGAFRWVACS